MSAPKHTPGPWKIGAYESGQMAVDGANGEEVTGFISPEDACLIAAAPELLEALRGIIEGTRLDNFDNRNDDGMLSWNGGYNFTKRIKAARAAIAKATGEKA
jgi:hypothetical protein